MGNNDYDEYLDRSAYSNVDKMVREVVGEAILDKSGDRDHNIHSGHFMVSCLQDDNEEENETTTEKVPGFDFDTANKVPTESYQFGNNQKATEIIDGSLTKLFQCMSLAYSGKLTSPKWKNFKGMKLTIKDKVRLNNIIWREWHLQYIKGNTCRICLFEPPVADRTHTKAEAVVLEGKYWKRKLASVTSEYQKWRLFHKLRVMSGAGQKEKMLMKEVTTHAELLEKLSQSGPRQSVFRFGQTNVRSGKESPVMDPLMSEDDFMDLSDTLFSTLSGPLNIFPNPRDFGQLGNADIIQPGLLQLQPAIEEEMDTQCLEPLPSLQEMMGGQSFISKTHSVTAPSSSMMIDPSSPLNDVLFTTESFFGGSPQPTTELSEQVQRQITAEAASPLTTDQFGNQVNTRGVQGDDSNVGFANCFINTDFLTDTNSISNPIDSSTTVSSLNRHKASSLSSLIETSSTISQQPQEQQQSGLQSDTALQLLNVLLGSNVGGNTNLIQQVLNSGGLQQTSSTNAVPQQILQVLLQIQQQQSQQQQLQQLETQQLQQQIQQLLQQPQVQQSKSTQNSIQPQRELGARSPVNIPLNSAANQPQQHIQLQTTVARPKDSTVQVIPYPQLQTLLQGCPSGSNQKTVTFQQQPQHSTNITAPAVSSSNSHLYRQASHGLLGNSGSGSASSTQLSGTRERKRSKSGETEGKQEVRRYSAGSVQPSKKATGGFVVPQNPVVPRVVKQQIKIAPAPPAITQSSINIHRPSPASQNTFLAKLLTSENLSNFPVKEEKAKSTLQTIKPKTVALLAPKCVATTTSTVTMSAGSNKTMPLTTSSLHEYHKGLLIAANSPLYSGVASTVKLSDIISNSATIAQCNTGNILSTFNSGNLSNPCSPQFRVPSPTDSTDSLAERTRHPSNESVESPPNSIFSLSCVKEEQIHSPGRGSSRRKTDLDPTAYKEHRRTSHINAEQKRRYNIKYGFDTLVQLVPTLTQNPNAKVSKAAILNKSAEYCIKLKRERAEMHTEAELLKQEVESLNQAISTCQSQLPATGVPVTRQTANKMKEKFDEYVRQRTLQNWKFWIFSIVIQPLFDSYNNMVSMATMEELCRTTMAWLEQHCSLPTLRPGVSNSLLKLNTSTSILSDPSKVPEQAIQAVQMQSISQQSSDENSR